MSDRWTAQREGRDPARATLARAWPGGVARAALESLPEQDLWAAHAAAQGAFLRGLWSPLPRRGSDAALGPADASLLELKAELARRLLGPCRLCYLRCPVDRRRGELGRCRLGASLRVYRDFVHLGEELELIPTHAIYLAGCNYRCPYCSEEGHVTAPEQDAETEPARLARALERRRAEGCVSASFVGGDPTVNLPGVLQALVLCRADVPLVWNSNLSGTALAHDLLEGVVDAWVADLKFGSEGCARAGGGVDRRAPAAVRRNLRRVARDGAYLLVRHLVLPGHVECCSRPALEWLAEAAPAARLNVMGHYQPTPAVAGSAWDARPSASDVERVRALAAALGFDLEGPGRAAPPALPEAHDPAAPLAEFESRIRFGPDGRVVVEDLDPELAELLAELSEPDPELNQRHVAGQPWRPGPSGTPPDPELS